MPVVAYLFPCIVCGHKNKIAKTVDESIRKWLLDQLPTCNGKHCGRRLEKSHYSHSGPRVELIRRQLKSEGLL